MLQKQNGDIKFKKDYKRMIVFAAAIFMVLSVFTVMYNIEILSARDDILDRIADATNFPDLPASSDCTVTDTHGGWLGDGITFEIIKYAGNAAESARNSLELHAKSSDSHWNSFPMTENLQLALYGSYDASTHTHYGSFPECKLPQIKNGWWFFENRHSRAKSQYRYDDRELFSLFSFNFTAAIYDADTDTLYYMEIDT